jgi:hypothetical protein
MASKEEQKRRKALVRTWQGKERVSVEADAGERLPFPTQDLVQLFRYIDDGWEEYGCDHTPRRAVEHLNKVGLSKDEQDDVLEWLIDQGGACDCEILANVVEHWVDEYKPEEWNFEGIRS